jgi:hypothetical protein
MPAANNANQSEGADIVYPMQLTSTRLLLSCAFPNKLPHTGSDAGFPSGGTATLILKVRGGPRAPFAAAAAAALLAAFCLLTGTAIATIMPNSSASNSSARRLHVRHFFLRGGSSG